MWGWASRSPLAIRAALLGTLIEPDRGPSWLAGRTARVRWSGYVAIGVLTAVAYSLSAGIVLRYHPAAGAATTPLVLAQVLPLPLLVRYPRLAWRVGLLAAFLTPLAPGRPWGSWPWDPVQIPVFGLAFLAVGLRARRDVLWTMWALMLCALWAWVPNWGDRVGGGVAFTAVAIGIDGLAGRLRAQRELLRAGELTEVERARRAVLEERARIARELHDVVAHHMSLIAVRAETAPYRHTAVPEPLREELAAIGAAAREGLRDMRRLLGVLRGQEAAELAPQPGLADVPELVASARRAGARVELDMTEEVPPVPATVGVCAYRIVQEALSNAGRHAAGAPVRVTVRDHGAVLHLAIVNGPAPAPSPGRPGNGLAGMRERVALLAGELSTGPTRDGGFAVRAAIPAGIGADIPHDRARS